MLKKAIFCTVLIMALALGSAFALGPPGASFDQAKADQGVEIAVVNVDQAVPAVVTGQAIVADKFEDGGMGGAMIAATDAEATGKYFISRTVISGTFSGKAMAKKESVATTVGSAVMKYPIIAIVTAEAKGPQTKVAFA